MKIRVVKENIKTGEKTDCYYPRGDRNPVIGDTEHKYYFIEQKKRPVDFDHNKYFLEKYETFIEESMTCERGFKLAERSKGEVIELLDNSLLNHLDGNYPLWKRLAHLEESLDSITSKQRKDYIKSLKNWKKACRAERDDRELEFIKNNIFPSFEWTLKPEKK